MLDFAYAHTRAGYQQVGGGSVTSIGMRTRVHRQRRDKTKRRMSDTVAEAFDRVQLYHKGTSGQDFIDKLSLWKGSVVLDLGYTYESIHTMLIFWECVNVDFTKSGSFDSLYSKIMSDFNIWKFSMPNRNII